MADELAAANVSRSYSIVGTSIAIFTFMLFFMYPRFLSGEISPLLFQAALVVMGVATFSLAFASFYYYCASAGKGFSDAERGACSRRADRFWLLGYTLLFFDPSLILLAIRLRVVAAVWFALWLVYLVVVMRFFPKIQTMRTSG